MVLRHVDWERQRLSWFLSAVVFVVGKVALGLVRIQYFGLTLPVSFHQFSILTFHSSTNEAIWAATAQSVYRLATGWTGRGSNPRGARISAPVLTGPGAYPVPYAMGTGFSPGVKRPRRGVYHPPDLAPRLRKE